MVFFIFTIRLMYLYLYISKYKHLNNEDKNNEILLNWITKSPENGKH